MKKKVSDFLLNVLSMTFSQAKYLSNWEVSHGIWTILILLLSVIIMFLIWAYYLDYKNLKSKDELYKTHKHIRGIITILCTMDAILFAVSCINLDIADQYSTNYSAMNYQRQMHHIKKIYPRLPQYRKHSFSNSITKDVQYSEHNKLTKSSAQNIYTQDNSQYKKIKIHVKAPIGYKVHNKAKLFNLHWWNLI